MHNENITHSPVKDVFALCIPFSPEDSAGRMSWDETAVFVAVNGWKNNYELLSGNCSIDDRGLDEWKPGTRQFRLVEKTSPEQMGRIIKSGHHASADESASRLSCRFFLRCFLFRRWRNLRAFFSCF